MTRLGCVSIGFFLVFFILDTLGAIFGFFMRHFWRFFGVLFTILAGFAVDVQVRLQIGEEMLLIRDIR